MKVTLKKIQKTLNQFPGVNFKEFKRLNVGALKRYGDKEFIEFLEDNNGIKICLLEFGAEITFQDESIVIGYRKFETFPAFMCSVFSIVKDCIEWLDENTDPYSF